LRSSTFATNDLALALRTLGDHLGEANQKSPLLDVAVIGTPRDLHPIVRDEAYRIAAEALRNAFRHARANRIEVEIYYDQHHLRLRISDDGKGIDPQVLGDEGRAGHWGLHGMRERAKLLGGDIELWSSAQSGTAVQLTIPASTAYNTRTSRWSLFSRKETPTIDE
jgi:signal transduction histidine kinase